jgi:hypothetical protein
VKQTEIVHNLKYVTNGIRRVYLQYLCARQHEGSGGTLLEKESGIGNSLSVGDELVCVFKTILLYSLKFLSLGNWGGFRLVLPKDWHMSANYGKFQRKLY